MSFTRKNFMKLCNAGVNDRYTMQICIYVLWNKSKYKRLKRTSHEIEILNFWQHSRIVPDAKGHCSVTCRGCPLNIFLPWFIITPDYIHSTRHTFWRDTAILMNYLPIYRLLLWHLGNLYETNAQFPGYTDSLTSDDHFDAKVRGINTKVTITGGIVNRVNTY